MTPIAWFRLRPKWVRDVTILTTGLVLILATVAWASRGAFESIEDTIPLWVRLVALGAGGGGGVMAVVYGLRSRNRSTANAATQISAEVHALGLRFGVFEEKLTRIDGALSGYNGSGGIIGRIATVEGEVRTVDDRIRQSRHALRSELTELLMRSYDRVDEKATDIEKRFEAFTAKVEAFIAKTEAHRP